MFLFYILKKNYFFFRKKNIHIAELNQVHNLLELKIFFYFKVNYINRNYLFFISFSNKAKLK